MTKSGITTMVIAKRLGRIIIRLDLDKSNTERAEPVPDGQVAVYVQASFPQREECADPPVVFSAEQVVDGNTPLEFLKLQVTRNLGAVINAAVEEILRGISG